LLVSHYSCVQTLTSAPYRTNTPRHRGRSQKRRSLRDAVSEDAGPQPKRNRPSLEASISTLKDRVSAMVSSREVALTISVAHFFSIRWTRKPMKKINDAKINLEEIQNLQKSMRKVPESSGAVVRLLMTLLKRSIDTTAGLGVLVDSLLRNMSVNRADVTAAKSNMARMSLPKLSDGAKLQVTSLQHCLCVLVLH
ncbi:hypothetical protein ANCCAN_09887, partial [Ancylostoma caninum]